MEDTVWQLPSGGRVRVTHQKLLVPLVIERLTVGKPNQILDLGHGITGFALYHDPDAVGLWAVTPDGEAYTVRTSAYGPPQVGQGADDHFKFQALSYAQVAALMHWLLDH